MQTEIIKIKSNFDGLDLEVMLALPSMSPVGVIQISHGMCEFKERYLSFMQFFTDKGYIVVCPDQRGHGNSVKKEEDRGYFYETKAEGIIKDCAQITTEIKNKYPNLPITLFGHSMGSMIVRCYLQHYDTLIDKLIVCGSPSKNPLAFLGITLTKIITLFKGERHRSKVLSYLSTGHGDKNFPGEDKGAWLSRNKENVKAYRSDKRGNYRFTCNGFENLFRLMQKTYTQKLYKVQNPNLPIHFVSGSDDAVMVSEKKFKDAVNSLREVGYQQVTYKLYEGMRHEVHNELEAESVLYDLLAFIEN